MCNIFISFDALLSYSLHCFFISWDDLDLVNVQTMW